ncbi:ankyrin repeat domain-containing protein [Thermonema sp.]|uniref:ankyrin repeat domain-containing protein n=1 Tax=Thermonema sp. TaxID=2231181 RepID=UPI0035B640D9
MTESAYESSPLNRAIEENMPGLVKSLIEDGMDPNGLDSVDVQPLTLAIQMDNLPIAQLLVSLGADVNLENWNRETPLMVAVMNSSLPFIEFLLEQGAITQVDNIEGYTPLLMAIWKSYDPLSIVRLLIEKGGANPNDTDYDGRSALMYAALREDKALIEYLLQKGADKTLKDSSGKTAADYTESKEIKQLLVD